MPRIYFGSWRLRRKSSSGNSKGTEKSQATSDLLPAVCCRLRTVGTSLVSSKPPEERITEEQDGWRIEAVAEIGSNVSDYKRLQVWRKAHALALNAHRSATHIRGTQYATFRNQIIRAAMSIPTNIVEGREQQTEAAFGRFLRIALGSASELEYHLMAARDIQAITRSEYLSLSSQVVEVRMMLHGLLRRLKNAKPVESAIGNVPAS